MKVVRQGSMGTTREPAARRDGSPTLRRLLRGLRLFVFDVDGVLTDGALYLGPGDLELKRFAVEDGTAFRLIQALGKEVAVVSGRASVVVTKRARELGVREVVQGVADKAACLEGLCRTRRLELAQVFFQGDDLIDLKAMRSVGCPVAPANAVEEVRRAALYVTPRPGGAGAARDAVEWVLRESGEYERAVAAYAHEKRARRAAAPAAKPRSPRGSPE